MKKKKQEKNKLLIFLQERCFIDNFVIEALDKMGYNTVTHLKIMDEGAINNINANILKFIQKFVYFREYHGEENYINFITGQEEYHYGLKTADMHLLLKMPQIIEQLEVNQDAEFLEITKRRKSTYYSGLKRPRDDIIIYTIPGDVGSETPVGVQEDPISNQNESSVESSVDISPSILPPTAKKPKFDINVLPLFETFVSQYLNIAEFPCVYESEYDKFYIICKCTNKKTNQQNKISVGFKTTTKGLPSFSNTNIHKHKCFATKINNNSKDTITSQTQSSDLNASQGQDTNQTDHTEVSNDQGQTTEMDVYVECNEGFYD